MREFSCSNLAKSILYMHLISDSKIDLGYHFHDMYEIYFLISGNVDYFIDRKIYLLEYGDLLVINNREIHKPSIKSIDNYERIIIEFDPSILSPFCSSDFNLLSCFTNRQKGEQNRISLNKDQIEEIYKLFENFENLKDNPSEGSDILKFTYLIELLVFLNKAFSTNKSAEKRLKVPKKILPILDYIDSNLEDDLTLATIASKFYIDKYHLSRIFKNITGINIHDYILSKRIAKAKQLLSSGRNILDSCQMSGFKNYTTFIRTFKSIVGTLPKDYQKGSYQTSDQSAYD
jgi:AraC-like DNA-binding protein